MGHEITADLFFEAGQCAPRGTYVSLETGLVHRISKRSCLPESGPFRMIAPTTDLVPDRTPVMPARWPEEESARAQPEPDLSNWSLFALFRITRMNTPW